MEQVNQVEQAINPLTNLVEEWINGELSNGEEVIEIMASSETRSELSEQLKDYLWESLKFPVSIRKNNYSRSHEFMNNLLMIVLTDYVQWEVIEDCYFKWELIEKDGNPKLKPDAEIEEDKVNKTILSISNLIASF